MRALFTQERVAASADLFLVGLFGGERRKTGWMRAEAEGDPGPWRQQAILGRGQWNADDRNTLCWCRGTRISVSRASRGLKKPAIAPQIGLQTPHSANPNNELGVVHVNQNNRLVRPPWGSAFWGHASRYTPAHGRT